MKLQSNGTDLTEFVVILFKKLNYRIGTLTEYFKFTDVELVLEDLRQMQPKVLEPVELELMEGNAQKATPALI